MQHIHTTDISLRDVEVSQLGQRRERRLVGHIGFRERERAQVEQRRYREAATDGAFLGDLVALEVLELGRLDVDVDSMAACAGLTKLQFLRVEYSDAMARLVRSLPRIEGVDVEFF